MTSDRHREKPLSLRLGAERQRLEDYARDTGQPVRRVIAAAVKAWLEGHPPSPEPLAGTARQGSLTEEECVRIGGHCFERTGLTIVWEPPQYPETCKHCGKQRVAIPQEPFTYRDLP